MTLGKDWKRLWSFCVLGFLAACGGGGGTGGGDPPPAPLGVPANVQATAGDGAVTLSWEPVSGADGYVVYVAAQAGVTKASWASLAEGARLTGRTSPALLDGLTNGTTYHLRVTAVRTSPAAEGAESAEVTATPAAPVIPGDTTPATGLADAIAATTATLHGTFTGPSGYTTSAWFEYGPTPAYGSSTPSQAFLTVGPVAISAPVTGLPPLTTIHYRLVTQNAGGTFSGSDATLVTLGEPEVLLSDLDGPVGPVPDGGALFWIEVYANRIRRHDLATSATTTIAMPTLGGNSAAIAADASWLYFTDGSGGLGRVAHDGGSFDLTFSTVVSSVSQIVAHPTGLYVRESWSEAAPPYTTHQYLTRVALDGATATRIFERTGGGSSGFGGGLAVGAGGDVYFADYYGGTVSFVPAAGGGPVVLAMGLSHPDGLLLDGADLFVADDGGIERIGVTTGASSAVCATPGPVRGMAKDGGALYVAGGNGVGRIDVATGALTLLALVDGQAGVPVVTPTHVYWITAGNHYYPPLGTLSRLPKP